MSSPSSPTEKSSPAPSPGDVAHRPIPSGVVSDTPSRAVDAQAEPKPRLSPYLQPVRYALRSLWRISKPHIVKPVDVAGLHYVVRIFIGCSIAWFLTGGMAQINPLWAVISVIAVTEPQMKPALASIGSRALNTIIGCMVGLFFLISFGVHTWLLPLVAAIAAFISIHMLSMRQGWRVGPITTALVMSAGLVEHSTGSAVYLALERASGVFTGSFVALLVTWVLSMVWMPPATVAPTPPRDDAPGN